MTAEERARAAAAAMLEHDRATPGLGIAVDWVAPGQARTSMRVGGGMLNGHGTCHGGYIFALADSAFAFACNTESPASVASHCSITFLRPAREGELLVACAEERHREGRQGLYDVRVTSQAQVVAEFRGLSRTTGPARAAAETGALPG